MLYIKIESSVQFFRLYMGLYNSTFPDVHVQDFPDHFFLGSRVHVSADCTSVAVSYSSAVLSHQPPHLPTGSVFHLFDSTLWYSNAAVVEEDVIEAAELSRDRGETPSSCLLLCDG